MAKCEDCKFFDYNRSRDYCKNTRSKYEGKMVESKDSCDRFERR